MNIVVTSLVACILSVSVTVCSSSSSSGLRANINVDSDDEATLALKTGFMNRQEKNDIEKDFPPALKLDFFTWMKRHGKRYASSQDYLNRMAIWMENHAFIESHNSQRPPPSYTLGHNQFSDMTVAEYRQYNKLGEHSPGLVTMSKMNMGKYQDTDSLSSSIKEDEAMSRRNLQNSNTMMDDLPDQVDWVQAGAVVPVKNQGLCGSCWAFSAICAIEGAHFLDTGNLVSLSEQELVDCDKNDLGCSGGLMDNAFLFDENSTGICSEADYPYQGIKRMFAGCATDKGLCESVDHTRVKSFIDVENTVDALMEAIAQQPVSVAIEADLQSFQFYKTGVYSDPACGNNLDHGVAAVGYGTDEESGQDYFLVRNSWGSFWGENGYVKLGRQSENVNGTCGILGFASRPILRDD